MAVYKALPAAVRHGAPEVPDARRSRRSSWASSRSSSTSGMTIISEDFLSDSILLARPRDRVLLRDHRLRVRLVLPPGAVHDARQLLLQVPVPAARRAHAHGGVRVSAIDMFDPDYGYTVLFGVGGVFVIGIGSLLLGVVLMIVWSFFPGVEAVLPRARASTRTPRCWCPTTRRSPGRSTADAPEPSDPARRAPSAAPRNLTAGTRNMLRCPSPDARSTAVAGSSSSVASSPCSQGSPTCR